MTMPAGNGDRADPPADAAALACELAAVRSELANAVAAHKAFAYSVSHDLRAPLRAIAGFAGLLEEDLAATCNEDTRRLLTMIGENTRALNAQIDALLTLSRLEHRELKPSTVDMAAAARSAVESTQLRNPERAVTVNVADLPPACADPDLMGQVFAALVDNAWKFSRTAPAPTIAIGATAGADEVVYFVRDNGVGFASSAADRLFTVFRRLHRADEFEGLGLGLAIVRTIVGRHHGRVWATCDAQVGTTFSFSLPRTLPERIGTSR